MKTQKEIEQLAEDFSNDAHGSPTATFLEKGFIHGYTQCQEDMADEIKEAYEQGLKDGYACMPSTNSLNKQD
jgi:hypothetical protein